MGGHYYDCKVCGQTDVYSKDDHRCPGPPGDRINDVESEVKTLQEKLLNLEIKVSEERHDHLTVLAEMVQEAWAKVETKTSPKAKDGMLLLDAAAKGSLIADEVLKRGPVERQKAWTKFFVSNMSAALLATPLGNTPENNTKLFISIREGAAALADLMLTEWDKRFG